MNREFIMSNKIYIPETANSFESVTLLKWSARLIRLVMVMLIFGFIAAGAKTVEAITREARPPESISASEFSRLIRDFSEDAGYFHSDNFTSNENSYLTIVDKLRQRSEERRVGKECRSRWGPCLERKEE